MDTFSTKDRSKIMSHVRSRGNKSTELKFIQLLKNSHLKGWRRDSRIQGAPDFIFKKDKVAVFIDGCFWHGCSKHLRLPSSNKSYWNRKIRSNMVRDKKVTAFLKKLDWTVFRFWEHELKKVSKQTANKIEKIKEILKHN
ncbi:MAG: very short patch repair endonuclease [bacterium]|nr:very short patch repair endonuclease [bacterium]